MNDANDNYYGPFWMDSLDIKIDPKSELPFWVQIASVLAGQVARRRIKMGEFVCSVRQVARYNKVSATNISKAFGILKERKILESKPQQGYVIGPQALREGQKLFSAQVRDLVLLARQQELGKKDVLKIVSAALTEE